GDVFAGRLADAETADPDKLSLLVVNGYDQVEFSINGGSSWEPMHRYYPGSGYRYPSLRDAVVLTSSTLLRYNSSAPSTVELTLRATDQLGLHYSVDTLAEGASPLSAEQITLTFETVDVPEAPEIIRLVYN